MNLVSHREQQKIQAGALLIETMATYGRRPTKEEYRQARKRAAQLRREEQAQHKDIVSVERLTND